MSKKMFKLISLALILSLLASMTSLVLAAPPAQDEAEPTLVELAVESGQFTTLVEALEVAGLDETLQGDGPFTVFAPTDEAFAALPAGELEALFNDIPTLTDVLLYHVVEGQVMAADVTQLEQAETLTGRFLTVSVDGETVMIDGAQVITPDLEAANGVIHVVDTVLLPPAEEEAMEEETMEEETMEEETMEEEAMEEEAAAEETAPAESDAVCAEEYVIQADDTLGVIAERFLGSSGAFQVIVEATNEAAAADDRFQTIDDPNLIFTGQLLCIPASAAEAETGTGAVPAEGDAAAPAEETTMEETETLTPTTDIPEGMSMLVFENFSGVDLVFDLTGGPTVETAVVPPDTSQEFIIEPGSYAYNSHQPGGPFSVKPGTFDITAGQVMGLTCYAVPDCFLREVDLSPAMAEEETMTEEAAPEATTEEAAPEEPAETETAAEETTAEETAAEDESMADETAAEETGEDESMADETAAEETGEDESMAEDETTGEDESMAEDETTGEETGDDESMAE